MMKQSMLIKTKRSIKAILMMLQLLVLLSTLSLAISSHAQSGSLTINRTPSTMIAGQPFTIVWSSTEPTAVATKYSCVSPAGGFVGSDTLSVSGSASGTADPNWLWKDSTCTWTVVNAAGSILASRTDIMKTVAAPVNGVTYIHTDGLGSPVAKSDANGNLIAGSRTRYEPYGMTVAGTATPTIGFTGHVNDADTGLTYMQQRYYDPVAARFLSEDPVLTDANSGKAFNRYVYANNNPYTNIDPDGRECVVANGRATCTPTMDGKPIAGLPKFSVPVHSKFPSMNSSSSNHHEYIYKTPIGNKSADSVRNSIANDPTGNHANKPASPTGTPNDATPTEGARGVLGKPFNNDVKSYTFNDSSGNKWTLNVTEASHTLSPGYVLRGVVNGQAVSYGEGTAFKQDMGIISKKLINNVWIDQNQRNVDNAK